MMIENRTTFRGIIEIGLSEKKTAQVPERAAPTAIHLSFINQKTLSFFGSGSLC